MIAGPGSGKTAVLTNRIKYLIENKNIPAENILTITFSKKAAAGMQQRFLNLCEDAYYPVTFGTFHSIFFHIINRKYHYTTGDIASLRNKREYMSRALKHVLSLDKAETELTDSLLKSVAYYKNCNESVRIDSDTNLSEEQFLKVYKAYRDAQIAAGKIDFEDMLLIVRNLFKKDENILREYRNKYRYILIDEYQDINDIQFDIVRMLAAPDNNLFVVGDDDQSIYGFRGSKSELMLGFADMYPEAVRIELNVNYRCADKIIDAAGRVIAENKIRFDKKIKGIGKATGTVEIVGFDDREQEDEWFINTVKSISDANRLSARNSDIAVFLRTNREASRYAELCRNAGLECDMQEAIYNPYKSETYRDIYHYLWLAEYISGMLVTGRRDGSTRQNTNRMNMERRTQTVRIDRIQQIKRIKLPVTHLFPIMNKPLRYLNRKNILCDEVSIEGLKDIYCDKPYMAKVLDTFAGQLFDMCDMDMHSRVNYIRKGIGYDEFVMNNMAETKEAYDVYTETADWIKERVKMFDNVAELDRYADEYEEMMANDRSADADKGSVTGKDKYAAVCGNVIHIMTYHASKGLEFDTVILPHLNEGSVPHIRSTGESQTEEERRMFYVAMTRAKNNLYMTYVSGKDGKKSLPSRFILPLIRNRRGV
ncbi:MAG: ATP-dependent helicase [Lachnospiraceae bacterium]|nr:ATP-dependent helicase [Lachnospiraceae bacterium]